MSPEEKELLDKATAKFRAENPAITQDELRAKLTAALEGFNTHRASTGDPKGAVRARTATRVAPRTEAMPEQAQHMREQLSPEAFATENRKVSGWPQLRASVRQELMKQLEGSAPVVMAKQAKSGLEALSTVLDTGGRVVRDAVRAGASDKHDFKPFDAAFKPDSDAGSFDKFSEWTKSDDPTAKTLRTAAGAIIPFDGESKEVGTDFALALMTDPLAYVKGGSPSSVPKVRVPAQMARALEAAGVTDKAAIAAASKQAAIEFAKHGGSPKLAAKLESVFTGAGAADVKKLHNVMGSNAEFAGRAGGRVGVPFMAERGVVEPGALLTKATKGKIPEQGLARVGEWLAKKLTIDAPYHTRVGVEDKLVRLREAQLMQRPTHVAPSAWAHMQKRAINTARANFKAWVQASLPQNVHAEVLRKADLLTRPDSSNRALKAWDGFINFFKESKLMGRPGFVAMNAGEDLVRNASAGTVDPRLAGKVKEIFKPGAANQALVDNPAGAFSRGDLQKYAKRYNLHDPTGMASNMHKGSRAVEAAKDVATVGVRRIVKPMAAAEGKYARTSHFVDRLQKGDSPALAGKSVRSTLHDNSFPSMNEALQRAEPVARRVVPFAGYFGRALTSVPKLMYRQPIYATLAPHLQQASRANMQPGNEGPYFRRESANVIPLPGDVQGAIDRGLNSVGVQADPSYGIGVGVRGFDINEPLGVLAEPLLGEESDKSHLLNFMAPGMAEALGRDAMTGKDANLSARPFPAGLGPDMLQAEEGDTPWLTGVLAPSLLSGPAVLGINEFGRAMGHPEPILGAPGRTYGQDAPFKAAAATSTQFTGQPVFQTHPGQGIADTLYSPDAKRIEGIKKTRKKERRQKPR